MSGHLHSFSFHARFKVYTGVVQAVNLLHESGIAHYDLKCDNIFLRRDPREMGNEPCVCIGDYGESRVLPSSDASKRLHRGRARGTECIKAPEMLMRGMNNEEVSN